MATDLPTLGNLAYNGVEFSTPCHTTSMAGNPVYDDAGRMVKYVEWTLSVSAYVTDPEAGADTSQVMENIRRKLTEPGKVLVYEGKGFGDVTINSGTMKDVAWGPKPELLTWQPIGADQTAYVEWRVSFRVPECDAAKFKNRIMAWCYDASFSVNEHGYLTFTYSGSVEIPLTFGAGGGLPDSADNYWEKVFPVLPLGFQRIQNQRTLSMDRSKLSFTIVDQELPVALPNGCTMASVKHSVRTLRAGRTINLSGTAHTISGTYIVNPKLPKSTAWLRFRAFFIQRVIWNIDIQPHPSILVTDFSAEEDVYGLTSSFSLSYTVTRPSEIKRCLQSSGLWTFNTLTNNSSFATWRDSVKSGPYAPKGNSGAYFDQQSDTIIDLCSNVGQQPLNFRHAVPSPPQGQVADVDANDNAAQASSWLAYETQLVYSEDNHVVRHTPLAGTVTETTPGSNPAGETGLWTNSTQPTISQRTSPPAATVRLVGRAVRLRFSIQPPILKTFKGQPVVQTRCTLHPTSTTTLCGTLIHGLSWDIEYNVSRPPDSLPLASTLIGPGGPTPPSVNLGTIGIVNPNSQGSH